MPPSLLALTIYGPMCSVSLEHFFRSALGAPPPIMTTANSFLDCFACADRHHPYPAVAGGSCGARSGCQPRSQCPAKLAHHRHA
eukprot:scaffold102633_cov20-Tisochrysis_lutea.AAC.1